MGDSKMYQTTISNIIIKLKKAKNNNPELSLQKISDETGVSKSTVTRIFADGSEDQSFRYDSLKPICLMLLGNDGIEDDMDYDEYQLQLAEIKDKYEKKLEIERDQFKRSKDFLMHQIELKDQRIDTLFDYVEDLKRQLKELRKAEYNAIKEFLSKNGRNIDDYLNNKDSIKEE